LLYAICCKISKLSRSKIYELLKLTIYRAYLVYIRQIGKPQNNPYTENIAEVSKNLTRYRSENNFVVKIIMYVNLNTMSNAATNFDILAISLNVLHDYFDM